MRVILDEHFPLPLVEVLQSAGVETEHIITLGQRGIADAEIRVRLDGEALLFLTNDTEFLRHPDPTSAWVLISRVRQSRPLAERLDVWCRAIAKLLEAEPPARVMELTDAGAVVPWKDGASDQSVST